MLYGIIVILIIAFLIYRTVNKSVGHSDWGFSEYLEPDAKVMTVQSEVVGSGRNNKHFKTTVIFSDGFKYYSFCTEREDNILLGTYRISVYKNEVVEKAKKAHEKAIKKYKKK